MRGISRRGVLYSDFESALPHYKSRGILTGDDLETTEFNDIMNFLYMGRKEKLEKYQMKVIRMLS